MNHSGEIRGQDATPRLTNSFADLPEEIIELLRHQQTPQFLDSLSLTALEPKLTLRLYAIFECIFTDTCARWTSLGEGRTQSNSVIEALARIVPLAPHLSVYLEKYLATTSQTIAHTSHQPFIQDLYITNPHSNPLAVLELQRILLAAFRLLRFDKYTFSSVISGVHIQSLLHHEDKAVRYLTVRIFCQLLLASDSKLEAMIQEYVGSDAVFGDFDGEQVDYGFLSLLEERRLQNGHRWLIEYRKTYSLSTAAFSTDNLSPFTVRYGNVLLPRPNGKPLLASGMVRTDTTSKNMEAFASSLLSPSPILLHGLAGSGKTSLVDDFARELGTRSNMVTMHLNEQTDAKMLIGIYATGSTPGSFKWRPGVLTTAVKEGRWVFIEDLDRAPNEVLSVILPLIERRELLIPSRGETIKAGRGFRLLASIRTSLNVNGKENAPAFHMLGSRLWQRVPVQMPSQDEFRGIIDGTYPILHKFLPGIISVYERLYVLSNNSAFASRSRTSLGRPISPRDLLKWCRRLHGILVAAGSKTGEEPITESVKYEMFLEATDCFSGSLQTVETRRTIVAATAEEMHIDPQRVEHFLTAHIPRYEDSETHLTVGRVRLTKRPANRISKASKKSRPFANTTHAKKLLEQVGVAVKMAEPVLLVGETGIGKTTVVQQLADSLGVNLTAVNLSQQSEVGDLLGGFKPVNVRSLAIPLKDEFDDLFAATGISTTKNQKYIEQLGKCVARSQWSKALKLWREAPKMFDKIISELKRREVNSRSTEEQPTKRRKTESRLQSLVKLRPRWERFSKSLDQFDIQLSSGSKGFAFNFVEGNIVKAARNGDWVLLDEINLASPDTLESIADLLHSGSGTAPSILLSETGEIERVRAHPDFRIFGAMNPATDVGKRDLPMGLRSRFTELYVESPDRNLDDLLSVIKAYLKGTSTNDEKAAHDVARLYLNTKRLTDEKRLVDGANQVPHFSLRTLTRVLGYVSEIAPSYGLRRSLYEGFAMGFLTLLNSESEKMLMPLINHHLLDTHGNAQSLLSQTPRHPDDGKQYVRFMNGKKNRQYWMLQGAEPSQEQPHYIITPFVERNMLNLVRATSTRKFPVLVQGPTSSGKTSMIEYLAKFSGNKFVRINNHEHTDLQEYLGTYVSGADGQLRFQEGLLVQALRQGHWIVLDELNLAPTDVLEALNRLLDDNRELLIPETQEIVRPHENFMLFATQNPPGLYGGRKTLSRAFRNRFLELHFDDIPEDELDFILEKRSQKVAPSDCRRIVAVYKELSRLRQSNRLFEQKDSFATLRDLFRWALRDADNREQLAANGYMLLAERVRNPEERIAVKEIIERVMKVNLDPNVLYDPKLSPEIKLYEATSNAQGIVWTQAMRRLYVLVAHALRNNEPVLLVGETGCGKTTVCQMLADAFGKDLNIVNAHQNTETGDLIGAQRPLRNRAANLEQLKQDLLTALGPVHGPIDRDSDVDKLLSVYRSLPEPSLSQIPSHLKDSISIHLLKTTALFEWSDGALVHALKAGQFFLLDEISLADDSVLERLNSVLEPARTILLAEKGTEDSFISAADGFQFLATMNPGGDYGKRELSPALRNRFTEIWVPSLSEHDDVLQIVQTKLQPQFVKFALPIVHFSEWFGQTYRSSSSASISVRDILAWIQFVNTTPVPDPYFLIVHGAAMVYVDTLGANPAALLAIDAQSIYTERAKCIQKLGELLQFNIAPIYNQPVNLETEAISLSIGGFSIGRTDESSVEPGFALHAPTTKLNGMRVLRALQVQKPILIEGSPGVGKTTLIAALARACNRPLTRINLSEQTDLMDLFGSDVPVEGAEAGHFAWRDAPFLQAMQKGEWVLLDEMNLASQSVLEGLNACLDHRGEVYISELDQTFKRHPEFSVFAAQNPHHQGGGRKGLPASFVNRFTVVYADIFRNDDLELICTHNFPTMDEDLIRKIIRFVSTLEHEVVHSRHFGLQGGPWEFNLRDVLRWLQLLSTSTLSTSSVPAAEFLDLVIRQRFRSGRDREQLARVFSDVFGSAVPFHHLFHNLSSNTYQVGRAFATRNSLTQPVPFPAIDFTKRLAEIESVMICIEQNLPCILVGSSGSGKTTLLEHIAAAKGKSLVTFPLNSDIDTMDLVGGFEQVDPQRGASHFLAQLSEFLTTRVLSSLPAEVPSSAIKLLQTLETTTDTSAAFFTEVGNVLESLKNQTSLAEFETLAQTCRQLAASPMTLESARFEWIDGLLVKAIEQGEWLVLDNANLCSASVLDRLNSLLEPNGVLSINEHCGPDGEPKLVRPHPEFRLFLTMDARFGELSRAMRNRAFEIFLEPLPASVESAMPRFGQAEASMLRYQRVIDIAQADVVRCGPSTSLARVAVDNLSLSDLSMLPRFIELCKGSSLAIDASVHQVGQAYMQMFQSPANKEFRGALGQMWEAVSQILLASDFTDAQILHPLQNSPLVPMLQQSGSASAPYWLGACLEFFIEIDQAVSMQRTQIEGTSTLKPSKMNRLQRSLVRERVPTVSKDSTINISGFLEFVLAALKAYIQSHCHDAEHWRGQKQVVGYLLHYWWHTYTLATSTTFDDATFQAHLAIGRDLLASLQSKSPHSTSLVGNVMEKLDSDFHSGFRLTTGLSMELLWKRLRPLVISDSQVMETTSRMETLAHRFDALKWKTAISISEVGHIMQSLCKAFKLLFAPAVDGASLLESINFELEKLENNAGETQDVVLPYFAPNFEVLRQLIELQRLKSAPSATSAVDNEIIVLSNYPTVFEMRDAISADSSHLLPGISNILGQSDQFQPVSNSMSYSLLRKLNDIRDVDMKSLRLLEAELPIIGKQLSKSTASLCRDQLPDVNEMLGRLVIEIVAAHSDNAARELNSWVASLAQLDMTASTPSNLRVMLEAQRPIVELGLASHVEKQGLPQLTSALYAIEASKRQSEHALGFSAIAWVQFAIASLLLYVPDRTFDPDKRQRLERERHQSLSDSLQDSVSALRRFEDIFTHQNSNARIQLLESEIADLGEAPAELQPVYRPAISELDQLQGEFNNIIRTFAHASIDTVLVEYFESRDSDTLQQIKLIQNNAKQIIRRLDERFPAYNDLTSPVVNMLHCLVLGLSFAILTENNSSASNQELQSLSQVTPFLGGTPNNVDESFVTSHPVQYLNIAAATASITTVSSLDSLEREHLFRAIHVCYEQWSKRLEHDRREEESAGGLYRFRGSAEDEDEEDAEQFNELFPSYDEDSTTDTNQAKSTLSARDAAIEVARVHASIFLGGSVPFESLLGLIRQTSTKMALIKNADSTANSTGMTKALLQGAFLLLSDYTQALSTSATAPDAYNFYTDAHLPETRKLVNLVHQIQTRFRELQSVDEIGHMQPLEDVLVSCRQLLQFSHTEPLAKIITKVEQIHTYMHEWQFGGWASRANSALSHYDNLTATIVSWRRLELSTWAKLFDMETKKCDDDARSWWFVAYQVTVAAPLQISGSPLELKEYAQKLLQDLEVYFSSAIIGQFTQRLELLKQLQLHLQALALDIPHLSIIHSALSNFIILYSSYEKPVQDHLKKGRLTLEKSMKDVLLMASWKDTNIVALRDSAKRSHHKLFKLVRKFRALLSQPMEFVIKQGIPDQEMKEIDSISLQSAAQPLVSLSALKYCEISVPGWSKKSKRFTQVSKTVGMMVDASQVPDNAIDGSDYLNSFLSDLLSNTVELQKATPSVLTDENKDEVKHLKTQKRKLFADTLKDLRRMGIKHNLGADALAKQSSLSATLAAAGHIASNEFQIPDLEYYFNKAVDLVPRAREAARQPSPDLSGAEVTRSSGFVEGMLEVLLSQHSLLASTSLWLKKLRTQLRQIEGLWAPGSYEIQRLRTASNIEKLLRWLPNIIKVAVHVIDIHAKMGQLDAKQISDDLRAWQDRFEVLTHDWDALAILPDGVISTKRQETESAIRNASEKFRIKLEDMVIARPDLAFALDQIVLWVRVELSTVTLPKPSKTIQDLDQKLSNSCDAVLLAIEKHKKDVLELSGSTEDQGWFIKHDSTLIKSIKSLHSKSVVSQLENCFAALRLLDLSSNEVSQAASAVFASALPIFQQYLNTLEQSVTRHASLHRTTCKAAYILTKSFVQITTQGFCTPSEKSDAQDGQTEKLEGGTGLGDGEGAQDISKDIQDDENLDELAQEPNTEKGEMEDEQDAVDMADGEMEGEMGDAEEKGSDDEGSDDGSQSGDDMDEETGDVDDLDPTAVDEKMWDGDGEQAEKDQEGDESKGKSNEDEQVAAQEKEQKKQAGEAEEGESGDENEEEDGGAEQGEEVKQDEVEKHDPHAPEGETLDLPEDMELDGEDDKESVAESDGGLEDMSDVEQDGKEDEVANDGQEENDAETADAAEEDQAAGSDMDVIDVDEDQNEEGEGDKTEDAGQQEDPDQLPEPDHDEGLLRDQSDEAKTDADNAMPSEAHGVGEDQEDNANDKESSTKAQRDNGGEGGDSSEQKDTAAEDGERGRQANGGAPKDSMEETQDTSDAQPFKKLGEALEQWHRQQTKIRDPAEQKPEDNQSTDVDPNSTEFQHLQDEDAQADTQALGTASEEQARALDESMAVDEETTDMPDQFQPDEVEMKDIDNQDAKDVEDPSSPNPQENSDAYEGRAGAMIKQAEERDTDMNAPDRQMRKELEEDVAEVDNQLESTHLDETTIELRSAIDAREQWTHYEAMTRDLSLSLTEQLRLILAPTLATKMRGDFRTGKRLNIKRIIPYIASQYKRDKIWMRRSVPSKRSYQIMLAVDDSKSMGESGSGSLAFETLVMVSKSLSMLEVGDICVLGFGDQVNIAHDFDTPFSSDAGPRIFQHFGFEQSRTDVTRLVRESIEIFRTARAKASSSPADLWQLQLIISDGVCDSSEHEPIRRLLREALEERIMMVFVIVDDVRNKKKGESVMDLKEARFVKDENTGQSNVKIERYLDTFPFQYYLIVSDVKELPGVLATLLRQWFTEVVDSSG
ncbi:P-loop containing nucleoside triphosphate hydrolase [Glarea lozoyensis ATCC 20868]|uniref:Midasin n=1 Tax=Glarea lozoyensis (strain ATCC 20868 / MF5171) TaxID=1116229 RepID=S3DZL1_GLAL2|nr:P-loop containing nucleoside triphosphate hydrolase [Glarea lozoyensis ATCC 20868]EPE31743.1 P-loop containing nucleoside triphosphate hydrolase [Glarea lozoyensis ATCC 20868]